MYECEMCMGHPFDSSALRLSQNRTQSNLTELTVTPHTTINPLSEAENSTLGEYRSIATSSIDLNLITKN